MLDNQILKAAALLKERGEHRQALNLFMDILDENNEELTHNQMLSVRNSVAECYIAGDELPDAEEYLAKNEELIDSVTYDLFPLLDEICKFYKLRVKIKKQMMSDVNEDENFKEQLMIKECSSILNHIVGSIGRFKNEEHSLMLIKNSIITEGSYKIAKFFLLTVLSNLEMEEKNKMKVFESYTTALVGGGCLDEAAEILDSIKSEKENLYGTSSEEIVCHLHDRANIHFKKAETDSAISLLRTALDILETLNENRTLKLKCLLLIDHCLHYSCQYDAAQQMQVKIREINFEMLEEATEANEQAQILINIAKTYRRCNDFVQSKEYYEKVLQLDTATNHKAEAVLHIGFSLRKMLDYNHAAQYLKEGIDLYCSCEDDYLDRMAKGLFWLGSVNMKLKRFHESLKYYNEVDEIRKTLESFDETDHKTIHHDINKAKCYVEVDQVADALDLCKQVLKKTKDRYGETHSFISLAYMTMHRAYEQIHDQNLALQCAKFVLENNEKLLVENKKAHGDKGVFFTLLKYGNQFCKSRTEYANLCGRVWIYLNELAYYSTDLYDALFGCEWWLKSQLLIELRGDPMQKLAANMAVIQDQTLQKRGIYLMEQVSVALAEHKMWQESGDCLKFAQNMMESQNRSNDDMMIIQDHLCNIDKHQKISKRFGHYDIPSTRFRGRGGGRGRGRGGIR